jgi:hypothetical protein
MKNLTSLLLIVPLFSILTVQTVRGQTEDEFRQEFEQYAMTHSESEWQAYALNQFAQMTTSVILQEAAWSLIEQSFTTGPCLSAKQQICDREFEQKMLEITATTTAAAAVCAFTAAGNPVIFAVCIAAVAVQHAARLAAAQNAHRTCYFRARLDCLPTPTPTPSPNHCSILGPEGIGGIDASDEQASTTDVVPLIADCSLYEDPCLCPPRSPIMIDVAGNGFDLTNVADGVMFNITGFGREPLGWTRPDSDDAFLALDLNANGLIDNGAELFGNFTAQPEPAAGAERNGFAALAVFDYNGDGKINRDDTVYSELRLWQDRNHNGVSEAEELQPLDKLGLNTLFLNYRRSQRVDKFGNEFRYRAKVNDFGGRQLGRWAWDVFLVSSRPRLSGVSQWQQR